MTIYSKIMIGSAGIAAALTIAAPAAAQQPYGYAQPYQNNNGGIIGAIVNSVTGNGYGQYPMGNYGYQQVNERNAVSMCAAAAEHRLNATYRGQPGYGYQNGYGQNGYQNGMTGARVLGITNVQRRGNGSLKVTGVATSGQYAAYGNQGQYQNGYGYNGQRGYNGRQTAELQFSCKVTVRGQVSDLNITRNRAAYRGY
jgi:hypothetical protein